LARHVTTITDADARHNFLQETWAHSAELLAMVNEELTDLDHADMIVEFAY